MSKGTKTDTLVEKKRSKILAKWEKKKAELRWKESNKMSKRSEELREKADNEYARLLEKAERKSRAYMNRKLVEYDRRCKNEIRKLEGKEEKKYKIKKKPLNLVEFAMEIMQENAKLRDTDILGNGICVSDLKFCTWGELAGGHRWSRRIKNICLCLYNINAQCNGCNFTTGPRGDKVASDRVNAKYDQNIDKKWGEGTSTRLRGLAESYFKNDYDENWVIGEKIVKKDKVEDYLVKEYIPEIIEENELRWNGKDFYKPGKKWRKIWEGYVEEHAPVGHN